METVITPTGLARLTEELGRLTTDGRREIAERLAYAAAREPNHLESSDFLDAREEQAQLERRIMVLEERLLAARLVEPDPANGRLDVGERARLRDVDSGDLLELELVGPLEADPAAGRISVASPVGMAIVGLGPGEIAEVDAPRGTFRLELVAVGAPEAALG